MDTIKNSISLLDTFCIPFLQVVVLEIHKFSSIMNLQRARNRVYERSNIIMGKTSADLYNGGPKFICAGRQILYQYEGKTRVSEIPIGHKYLLISPTHCFENIEVKAMSATDALAEISDSDIVNACATLKPIWVKLIDGVFNSYSSNNKIVTTGTASGIELVQAQNK